MRCVECVRCFRRAQSPYSVNEDFASPSRVLCIALHTPLLTPLATCRHVSPTTLPDTLPWRRRLRLRQWPRRVCATGFYIIGSDRSVYAGVLRSDVITLDALSTDYVDRTCNVRCN